MADTRKFLLTAFVAYAIATLTSQAMMSIGAAILALAVFVSYGGPRGVWDAVKRIPAFKTYLWLSGALVTAMWVSLVVAKVAPLSWGKNSVVPHFGEDMAKSWYFAWPVILYAGLIKLDVKDRNLVSRSWLLALGLISIIGVIQYFTGWPRPQPIPESLDRFHTTMFFGHHLSTASILIFPFFMALQEWRKSLTGQALLKWPLLSLILLLSFATLMLTHSRTLWVALPLGILVWALRFLNRRRQIIAVGALLAFAAVGTQLPQVQGRFGDTLGMKTRWMLWDTNLMFLKLRPLTGAGFRRNIDAAYYYFESLPTSAFPINGYVFSGHAHNNLIDLLGGTGLLGAIAWLAWCFWVFKVLAGGRERSWGLLCAWIVFHLNGITQVNFWEGKVMHQMMWSLSWAYLIFLEARPVQDDRPHPVAAEVYS